jgi:hypothetical protein
MLCSAAMAVYCQNRTEHINTPFGRNAEILVLNLAVHTVITNLQRVNIVLRKTNVYLRNASVYTKAISRLFW